MLYQVDVFYPQSGESFDFVVDAPKRRDNSVPAEVIAYAEDSARGMAAGSRGREAHFRISLFFPQRVGYRGRNHFSCLLRLAEYGIRDIFAVEQDIFRLEWDSSNHYMITG